MASKKILILLTTVCAVVAIVAVSLLLTKQSDSPTVAADAHAGHEHAEGETHGSLASTDNAKLDWCAEHSVPESECTKCNPELVAKFKETGDWCGGHGLPESHCRLCNPEIVFPQEKQIQEMGSGASASTGLDWCAEHSVPESECTKCHSELIASFKETGDWCGPHDIPESHCRLCNPEIVFPQEITLRELNSSEFSNGVHVSLYFRPNQAICATNDAVISLATSRTSDRAGIHTIGVVSSDEVAAVKAPAETVFDETHVSVVTISVPALVNRWRVSPGDVVSRGEILADMKSPEVVSLGGELLAAHAELIAQEDEQKRHDTLHARNLISPADYQRQSSMTAHSRADVDRLKGQLLAAGLSSSDIQQIINTGKLSDQYPLRAPASGLVTERIAQPGELVHAGGKFLTIADPNKMWIEAHLSGSQLGAVHVGDHVVFSADGQGMKRVSAEIIWVSRYLDPHTRTGVVRARALDTTLHLNAGMFGEMQIPVTEKHKVVLAPKDAVQWEGCCNVVFVKETDLRYRPRKVTIASSEGNYYRISSGLEAGEEIVTDGAFLLKTELKKSSIGAGCCGIEAAG